MAALTGSGTLEVLEKINSEDLFKDWKLKTISAESLDRDNLYFEFYKQASSKKMIYIDKIVDLFHRFHNNKIVIDSTNCPTILIFVNSLEIMTLLYLYLLQKLPSKNNNNF